MRMRKKKHGAERIEACSELMITDLERLKQDPYYAFEAKDKPLCLEIGCGKGNFACGMAEKHPECNFIAMERVSDVCCIALEKAKACADTREDNLRFIIGNAENLCQWFPEHCIDTLYLNFSDPWHKKGHAKRRLTHRGFLESYRKVLKEGGRLIFKTDNTPLFDFSLEEFEACGLCVEWMTRDLHSSERAEDNVMTEYEKNFSEKGFNICSAIVRF